MNTSAVEFGELLDAVDAAYRRMRVLVIDELEPGEFPDASRLNLEQLNALNDFTVAEDRLRVYRSVRHTISLLPDLIPVLSL
jgi:hypothetical protein